MNEIVNSPLPNFFIVGAPKAGTTSLYFYLEQHPEIFMSPLKETNFFSHDATVKQNLYYKERGINNWNNYLALFKEAENKKAIGEASVSYLFYPEVAGAIKEKFPDGKIIIMLRNPVERALSHYYMDHKLGYVSDSFDDILFTKSHSPMQSLFYQQFIQLGFYFEQVERYITVFGKENVMIIFFEDFKNDTSAEIRKLYRFLAVDENVIIDTNKKHNAFQNPRNAIVHTFYKNKFLRQTVKRMVPEKQMERVKNIFLTRKKNMVSEIVLQYLRDLYKPDIQQLSKLVNRDLSSWYE